MMMSSKVFIAVAILSMASVYQCFEQDALKYVLRDIILSREEACTEESSMPESARNYLLFGINQNARSGKSDLVWDDELAKRAHDLSKACIWVGKKATGCNNEEVGILQYYVGLSKGDSIAYMKNTDNVDKITKQWITYSKIALAMGRDKDSDAMGHLYQTLSADETTSIGCGLAQPRDDCFGLRFICLTNKYIKY